MAKPESDFRPQLLTTMDGVRAGWLGLLDELGLAKSRPFHIAKELKTTTTLTWQLLKMVRAESFVESARYLPGKTGCRVLMNAFEKSGASAAGLEAVNQALTDYRRMVRRHAGSRQALHSMLLAQESAKNETEEVRLRKMGFQANSRNLGVQAQTRIGISVVTPSEKPGFINTSGAAGLLQFQHLLPNVRWPVLYLRGPHYTERERDRSHKEAMIAPSVLEQFSTSPLTDLIAMPEEDGTSYWLASDRVGLSGAVDCMFEWQDSLMPADEDMTHILDMKTPVERLVFTVLYHRSIEVLGPIQEFLYSRMQGPIHMPLHEHVDYHMPVPMKFVPFADASKDLDSPDIPFDKRLIEYCCGKQGRDPSEFRGWRLSMRYPPIPTLPCLLLPLR